jgi:Glycosyltransferase like family
MFSNSLDVTFVVSRSGNPSIFERNFAASPLLRGFRSDRIIVQEGFSSAASAYNDAIEKAKTDLIVFAHQDVYFPAEWLADLSRSLEMLEESDPDWGVLGCSGVKTPDLRAGYLYSVGLGVLGEPFEQPVPIDTLDEFILILRKSSGLRFDPTLPLFHFYGTDICMSARKQKRGCYAISAFTVHNTSYGPLAPEFYKCYWHVKKRWKEFLPIQTTCIKITRWNEEFIFRRFKHACFSLIGRNMKPLPRLEDPRSVLLSVPNPSHKHNARDGARALIGSK